MSKAVILPPISLGSGPQAEARLRALDDWARELGLFWNDQPSRSKLVQYLADERIKANENVELDRAATE